MHLGRWDRGRGAPRYRYQENVQLTPVNVAAVLQRGLKDAAVLTPSVLQCIQPPQPTRKKHD